MTQGKWYSSRSDLAGQIGFSIFILLMGSLLILWRWESSKVRRDILTNPRYSTAVLTKIYTASSRAGGHKTYFSYSFQTPEGRKRSSNGYSTTGRKIKLHPSWYPELVGKTFPIIYSAKYPEKPHLLLLRHDFRRYNLSFPDSLRWTEPFIYGSFQTSAAR